MLFRSSGIWRCRWKHWENINSEIINFLKLIYSSEQVNNNVITLLFIEEQWKENFHDLIIITISLFKFPTGAPTITLIRGPGNN